MTRLPLSYVLPVKWSPELDREEFASYVKRLAGWVDDVLVVDGSDEEEFAATAAALGDDVRHVAPDPRYRFAVGKCDGVMTGVFAAVNEKVVIADDDVRYEPEQLERVAGLLDVCDLVRPQNHFPRPMPWHALWDTGRTLLNRAVDADYPGTLAVRRSTFERAGGYDGDSLFENLELIRTIHAFGGTEAKPLDLYVVRLPPTTQRFLSQRVRQAYDEFALPVRMATWLAVVPFLAWSARRRNAAAPGAAAALTVAIAEVGRRRAGGREVLPAVASLFAPLWVLERGICMWLALGSRLRGGVRYGGGRIRKAANPTSLLEERARRAPAP